MLHPKVREKWISSINISSQSNFVVEVPLLFENDLYSLFTKTISVHASTNHQFFTPSTEKPFRPRNHCTPELTNVCR
ncbi:MAG: dephospho-CoA kinase [Opitutales bacterium]